MRSFEYLFHESIIDWTYTLHVFKVYVLMFWYTLKTPRNQNLHWKLKTIYWYINDTYSVNISDTQLHYSVHYLSYSRREKHSMQDISITGNCWGKNKKNKLWKRFSHKGSERMLIGNSLAVYWLEFHTSIAGDTGSIFGWGIKIPNAVQCRQKRKTHVKSWEAKQKGSWDAIF